MITEDVIKAQTITLSQGTIRPLADGVTWQLSVGSGSHLYPSRREALEAYEDAAGDDGTSCLNCGS